MRYRSYIFDARYFDASSGKRTNGGFATRARAFHLHLGAAEAVLQGSHRQFFTEVEIPDISASGAKKKAAAKADDAPAKTEAAADKAPARKASKKKVAKKAATKAPAKKATAKKAGKKKAAKKKSS